MDFFYLTLLCLLVEWNMIVFLCKAIGSLKGRSSGSVVLVDMTTTMFTEYMVSASAKLAGQ